MRLKDGRSAGKNELIGLLTSEIAKGGLPDDVAFVTEIPHTSTGKIRRRSSASISGTIACRRPDMQALAFSRS